jgi:hypothetical protein
MMNNANIININSHMKRSDNNSTKLISSFAESLANLASIHDIINDVPLNHRTKGRQCYMILVIFQIRKTQFLISYKKMEKKFKYLIKICEYPNRIKKEDLMIFSEV